MRWLYAPVRALESGREIESLFISLSTECESLYGIESAIE